MHSSPHHQESSPRARSVLRCLAVLCAALLIPASAAGAPGTGEAPVRIRSLDAPELAEIHLRVLVLSGSADDPAGKEGLAWFTAHLIGRDARALSLPLEVEVGRDALALHLAVPADRFQEIYPRFRDSILAPPFSPEEAAAQRASQAGRIRALDESVREMSLQALNSVLFKNHPYGHFPFGSPESVARLTSEDATRFHGEHVRRGNLILGLTGPLEETLPDRLRSDFQVLPAASTGEEAGKEAPRKVTFLPRRRLLVLERPGETRARIRIGHPIQVTSAHADYPSLLLASALARPAPRTGAGGEESADRFLARLEGRPTPGIERAGTGVGVARKIWSFVVEGDFRASEAVAGLTGMIEALERLRTGSVSQEDLDDARSRLLAVEGAPGADPLRDLLRLMNEEHLGSPAFGRRLPAALERIEPDALRAAAARHLRPGRIGIVALVPDAEGFIREILRSGGGGEGGTPLIRSEEILGTEIDGLFR